MATHKITLTLDESTGAVTVRHFCTATLPDPTTDQPSPVTVWEDVPADPAIVADLKKLLDPNRKAMEGRALAAAARHLIGETDRALAAAAKKAKAKAKADAE